MRLTVKDRLALLGVLPDTGDIYTLRIVRDLQQELSFTEEEHQRLNLTQVGGSITWNPQAGVERDIPIGPVAHKIITDSLIKLNEQKRLRVEHLPLYEMFVEQKEQRND